MSFVVEPAPGESVFRTGREQLIWQELEQRYGPNSGVTSAAYGAAKKSLGVSSSRPSGAASFRPPVLNANNEPQQPSSSERPSSTGEEITDERLKGLRA